MPSVETRTLFKSLQLGSIATTGHRVVLAPLTRYRAHDSHVHSDMAVEYYSQRCNEPGTVLITEATFISKAAGGYQTVPGIYTPDQIESWKRIVSAVHAKGCFMIMQMWNLGRAATPEQIRGEGEEFISSSNVPLKAGGAAPRPLTEAELKEHVAAYATASKNFIEVCGGDGVELHCGNGYLLNQFLDFNANKRTDNYGGSVENRTRFAKESLTAIISAVGAERVGLRVTPYSSFNSMKMPAEDTRDTYSHLVSWMAKNFSNMAYLHVVEARVSGVNDVEPEQENTDFLYDIWTPRNYIVAGGYTAATALAVADSKVNALVAIGRYFISNPDIVHKIKEGIEWTPYDRKTFYSPGPNGYTSYLPTAAKL